MSVVATLAVKITANTAEFEKNLGKLDSQMKKFGGQLQSAGSKMTAGITLPLVAFGGIAAKAAIDFESSFAGVKKTVNATTEEFAAMSQGMRDMAKEMPVSVNELNKIGEAAGQLGISKDNILDFTKTMAMLGATTNLTSDQAATGIAQIQNIFGASGQNTQNFASALVALGNAGASTESQILDFATRLAGAGNQAHMSQQSVLGFASALANVGLNAELGGTAMSTVFSKIGVAVDTGGAKLAKFAQIASLAGKGMLTAGGFKDLFKADSAEAITRFVEGLKKAGDKGQNLSAVLKDLGLKGSNVRDTLLRLAGSGDNLRSSLELSKQAWQDNTAMTAEFQKRADTTASQLQILWNKVNDVAITLGTALLPTLKFVVAAMDPLIGFAANMATGFAMLPTPVQAIAIAFVGLVAAAGPVIYIAGTLVSSWGSVLTAINLIPGGAALAGNAFALLSNPITIAIGLLATLAIGFAKVTGAAENAWNAYQKGGWNAVLGELGRNVNDDKLSLFKGGRLDQISPPSPTPLIGRGWTELIDPDIKTKTDKAVAAADELSKAAQRAAKAHADAIKALAGGLSGATAVKELTDLIAAWKSLSPELQKSDPVLKHVLDKFMQLGPELTNIPAGLRPVVSQLNEMAMAAGKFSEKVEDGISNLSEISKVVTSGMWDSFADVLALETPGATSNKERNAVIDAMPDLGKPDISDYIDLGLQKIAKETVASLDNSFKYFVGSLSGGMAALLGGLMNSLDKAAGAGGFLQKFMGSKGGQKLAAGLDIGMSAFGGGMAMGEQWGKGKGALAGAGSGALMGAAMGSVVPVIGTAIGAVVGGIAGFIGGLFGGGKKKKKEQAEMADARGQLLDNFGGMENLRKQADLAGVSIDLLFSTAKPEVFKAELEKVGDAIKVMQERIKGTIGEIDKVMSKGGLIGADLWKNILKDADAEEIKAKLDEVFTASVNRAAEGFNKIGSNFLSLATGFKTGSKDETSINEEIEKALKSGKKGQFSSDFLIPLKDSLQQVGVLADAALAGMLADGMSLPAALAAIAPGLDRIQQVLTGTGQQATGPLQAILAWKGIVDQNKGLFELLGGVDDMLTGLGNAGLLTQVRFTALGQTITQAFANLQVQGVAAGTALELMQPQLQKLWEAQQMFGLKTDAATQSLINQAVQQGLVGEQMKDVNHQILDVLTAIAKAIGADIPAALAGLPGAAQAAADGFKQHFDGMPDIHIGFKADWDFGAPQPPGPTGGTGSHSPTSTDWGTHIPHLAAGGIITRPTTLLAGEAGPEAIVPLNDYMQGGGVNLNIQNVYGDVDEKLVRQIFNKVAIGGSLKTHAQGSLR